MNILIAGFGGLGQAIFHQLRQHPAFIDAHVFALRRHKPEVPQYENLHWVNADLREPHALEHALREVPRPDVVIYCVTPDQHDEAAYQATYYDGLQNLYRAIDCPPTAQQLVQGNQVQTRWVFISSTAVYGAHLEGVADENSRTEPERFNGRVMLETEHWLVNEQPDALILRLSGIYGPQRASLLNMLRAGRATVPSESGYWANRIHVDDAARAVTHLLATQGSGVFVVSDPNPQPLDALYRTLASELEAPTPKIGDASPMMGRKRLSSHKLMQTGFSFLWPDALTGYRAIIKAQPPRR
jgi:nucleoside-diphosphate-sugar epimerase